MTLRTFNGIFESEREKETFYIESMLRKLSFGSDNVDIISQCRVTRNLAMICEILNDYGKSNKLPRSCVRGNEGFHYMCGKKWLQ